MDARSVCTADLVPGAEQFNRDELVGIRDKHEIRDRSNALPTLLSGVQNHRVVGLLQLGEFSRTGRHDVDDGEGRHTAT